MVAEDKIGRPKYIFLRVPSYDDNFRQIHFVAAGCYLLSVIQSIILIYISNNKHI